MSSHHWYRRQSQHELKGHFIGKEDTLMMCLPFVDIKQPEVTCVFPSSAEAGRPACGRGRASRLRPSLQSHLDLDEAFHSLDLGLAEGSSVLGADIRPHCQVGRLVCCLQHRHTNNIRTHTVPACTASNRRAAVALKCQSDRLKLCVSLRPVSYLKHS